MLNWCFGEHNSQHVDIIRWAQTEKLIYTVQHARRGEKLKTTVVGDRDFYAGVCRAADVTIPKGSDVIGNDDIII